MDHSTHDRQHLQAVPPSPAIPFYFQLEPGERDAQERFGWDSEGYLALELNRGAAIISVPALFEDWPDLDPEVDEVRPLEAYSDAVAAVLQLAAWHGFEPADICTQAIASCTSLFDQSSEAAADRAETFRIHASGAHESHVVTGEHTGEEPGATF